LSTTPKKGIIQNAIEYILGNAGLLPDNENEIPKLSPIDVLLEALSGIPTDVVFGDIAESIKNLGLEYESITEKEEGEGKKGGSGGKSIIRSSPQPPNVDIKPTTISRSAPVQDSQAVVEGTIIPNFWFHVASTTATSLITIIAELLSIGQIDKLLEPILAMLDLSDANAIFNTTRDIRLRNQVFLPYQYYVNNLNPQEIPSYSDLIRFRVRETREGKPILTQEEFVQQMRYMGYSEFWSNAIWDSHFTLPSNSELFDMYQRGIVTKEQLAKQLEINDIAPEWIDRIIQISKRYPTMPELRMMARRMPMPEELVTSALEAQGIREEYYPYFVTMFRDWDIDSVRGRRQTQIIGAYEEGILSDDEFRNIIASTGASTNEGEEMLMEAQFRRYRRRLGERQKTILKLLSKNLITRDDAENVLIGLGFEPIDVDHWLDYTVSAMGYTTEIEATSAEGIEGLESTEEIKTKFAEWEKLNPPIFYPIYRE
jgi:hypothetical protein